MMMVDSFQMNPCRFNLEASRNPAAPRWWCTQINSVGFACEATLLLRLVLP
jgi:hypothetical protein